MKCLQAINPIRALCNKSFLILLVGLSLLQGCASTVKTSVLRNPPPSEAFSAFSRIQLNPVVAAAGKDINSKAMERIQQNLVADMQAQLADWNQRPDNGRTLVITPIIEQLEFKNGASRVLFGPLAGSSGVLMRLQIRDKDGKEIANPEFFQKADAWAASFAMGAHDNSMLKRITSLTSSYIKSNFQQAVGGPTGAEPPANL